MPGFAAALTSWLSFRRWAFPAALFPLFLAVAVGLQVLAGAYQCEFGGHPDEAGHYVTGLLIRDFIARAKPGNPMAYAKTYYKHYPKVALGNWPPNFYLIQAAWTLPLGAGRTQVLALMAVLAALVASLIAAVAVCRVPKPLAAACGLVFLLLPLVQKYVSMVMTEPTIALLCLLAVVFWARYLAEERVLDSIAFGVVAATCILTKGTGLLLAGIPVISIILTRRWALLKRVSFWLAAVVVVVLAGPWTLLTLKLAKEGWEQGGPSLGFTLSAIPYYAAKLHASFGSPLLLLMLLGLVVAARQAWIKGKDAGLEASLVALVLSVYLFQITVPCGHEARHLIPALAGGCALIALGAWAVWQRLGATKLGQKGEAALLVALLVVVFAVQTFHIPPKGYRGFQAVAEKILATPEDKDTVLFVSSDARGEGMFISEIAMREKRLGHIVQRGSKLLASSSWSGGDYEAKAADAAQLVKTFADAHVGLIVVDTTLPEERLAKMPHHTLLEQTAAAESAVFEPLADYPMLRANERFEHGIRLYRFHPPQSAVPTKEPNE
jgi:hypothetical protein